MGTFNGITLDTLKLKGVTNYMTNNSLSYKTTSNATLYDDKMASILNGFSEIDFTKTSTSITIEDLLESLSGRQADYTGANKASRADSPIVVELLDNSFPTEDTVKKDIESEPASDPNETRSPDTSGPVSVTMEEARAAEEQKRKEAEEEKARLEKEQRFNEEYDKIHNVTENSQYKDTLWGDEAQAYTLTTLFDRAMEEYGDYNFACALVGNIMTESCGGNPGIVFGGGSTVTEGNVGDKRFGLIQAGGDRKEKLAAAYKAAYETNPNLYNDPKAMADVEIQFIFDELNGNYDKYWNNILNKCLGKDSIAAATEAVCRYYEGAVTSDGGLQNLDSRTDNAIIIDKALSN